MSEVRDGLKRDQRDRDITPKDREHVKKAKDKDKEAE